MLGPFRRGREVETNSRALPLCVTVAGDICVLANIGITAKERKKKQSLKVTLEFSYLVKNALDLNNINNVKDYSSITKYLKTFDKKRYIFNLGHGVLPETNPNMVKYLVDEVRSFNGQ